MKNTLLLFLCMLVFSCQQSSDNTTESIPVVDSVSIVNALLDALSIQIEKDFRFKKSGTVGFYQSLLLAKIG
jgi:hypothetical protein